MLQRIKIEIQTFYETIKILYLIKRLAPNHSGARVKLRLIQCHLGYN
jgi:hypothetical protein